MKDELRDEILIEPERYELTAAPFYHFEIARRDFFKGLGGGLLIVFALKETRAQQESGGGRRGGGGPAPQNIGAWLHIGEDGTTTVYTGKTEVGQDIRTSLAQVVAEELRAPLASMSVSVRIDSIGTLCFTFAKPSSTLPPTRCVGESGVSSAGC